MDPRRDRNYGFADESTVKMTRFRNDYRPFEIPWQRLMHVLGWWGKN
jgi:hypothetical protein